MSFYWYLLVPLFAILYLYRLDLRKDMLICGLFCIPILFLKPIFTANFWAIAGNNGIITFFLERLIIGFSFGAIVSVLYETFFHKVLSPKKHPDRKKMLLLIAGPLLFISLIALGMNFSYSILVSLAADLVIIFIFRRDLVWDAVFSGLGMGTLYLIIFLVYFRPSPGDLSNFWFTDGISKFVFFSLPIEELIAVVLFGALWGPLYVAIKDLREK